MSEYSEYKVAYTEVPATRRDDETSTGLLVHIRPSVQLNPDAVKRYLTFGDLEPLDATDLKETNNTDVKNVLVLGSTAVQTTIYASLNKELSEELTQQVVNDTVRLLQLMGATALIDNPPTTDV